MDMKKLADKIVDLLTNGRRSVPLIYVNFNYQKYKQDGASGSCICNVHPDLAHDEKLASMMNEMVDYIRDNYDMNKLVEL